MKIILTYLSKQFKTVLVCLIIYSCTNLESTSPTLKKGIYAWKNQSKLEQGINQFMFSTGFIIGDTLILLDSLHFKQITCGNFGFGKYVINGDSLYLNFDSTAFKRDSLWDYSKYTEVYYIEDENTLTRKFKVSNTKHGKENFKVKSELHYIENTISIKQ